MPEWVSISPSDELQQLWIELSEAVQTARLHRQFDQSNEGLRYYIKQQLDEGLTAALRLWLADNLMMDTRYEEAVAAYGEIISKHPKLTFSGKEDGYPWAVYALERTATCQEKAGDLDGALSSLKSVLGALPNGMNKAPVHYRMGRLLEWARRDGEAVNAYAAAAQTDTAEPGGDWPIGEFAKRQAASLQSPGKYFQSPEELSAQLALALGRQDMGLLRLLASPTHFCLGVAGAESQFVDREKTLSMIEADLGASGKIRMDPFTLEGGGAKQCMLSDGWNGTLLSGKVWFLLARLRAGWEWCGLALTQSGPHWGELIPAVAPQENQPVEIGMKAPWVRGECWRAGGLGRFLMASLNPLLAPFIILEDNFSCCGFGPGGYYFNFATHTGTHSFAIDFTRYITGAPFLPDAHFKDVLSVQDGVVTFVSPGIVADHDHSGMGNRVEVDSPGLGDLFAALLRGTPLVPPFKYRVGYWHLAGGRPILVSVGMFVRQGARLAFSDNTGNSFFSHLHFVVQDRDRGFLSARPSPLDSQRLEDGDAGKCVRSTNVAFP